MCFDWLECVWFFLTRVGDFLKLAWNWFVSMVPTIDAIGISLVTYYTFRLTVFPKKLKFINIKRSASAFGGDSVEITLENRSLCPAVIQSVDMIVGTHRIELSKEECIIEGFKTAKICMEPYSCIVSGNGIVKIDSTSLAKMLLLVRTTRGVQRIRYANISRFAWWLIRKRDEKYERTTIIRNYCNDDVVALQVKYALSYIDSAGECHTVLIHKSGHMDKTLFGYNGLPNAVMKNEATLKAHFDAEFNKHNMKYNLIPIKHPFGEEENIAP